MRETDKVFYLFIIMFIIILFFKEDNSGPAVLTRTSAHMALLVSGDKPLPEPMKVTGSGDNDVRVLISAGRKSAA